MCVCVCVFLPFLTVTPSIPNTYYVCCLHLAHVNPLFPVMDGLTAWWLMYSSPGNGSWLVRGSKKGYSPRYVDPCPGASRFVSLHTALLYCVFQGWRLPRVWTIVTTKMPVTMILLFLCGIHKKKRLLVDMVEHFMRWRVTLVI